MKQYDEEYVQNLEFFIKKNQDELAVENKKNAHLEAENKALREKMAQFKEDKEELEVKLGKLKKVFKNAAKRLSKKVLKFKALSCKDGLTKLYNRRAFDEKLLAAVSKSRRYNENLSLIILDIDFFKKCNDEYGHLAGDKVLQGCARVFKDSVRQYDVAARYGGEEFIGMLPKTDIECAEVVAERFRKSIEDTKFEYEDKEISITVSVGVVEFKKEELNSDKGIEIAFARGDNALYDAKNNGRNRVVLAK